jgi:hypothetical protein
MDDEINPDRSPAAPSWPRPLPSPRLQPSLPAPVDAHGRRFSGTTLIAHDSGFAFWPTKTGGGSAGPLPFENRPSRAKRVPATRSLKLAWLCRLPASAMGGRVRNARVHAQLADPAAPSGVDCVGARAIRIRCLIDQIPCQATRIVTSAKGADVWSGKAALQQHSPRQHPDICPFCACAGRSLTPAAALAAAASTVTAKNVRPSTPHPGSARDDHWGLCPRRRLVAEQERSSTE